MTDCILSPTLKKKRKIKIAIILFVLMVSAQRLTRAEKIRGRFWVMCNNMYVCESCILYIMTPSLTDINELTTDALITVP